MSKKFNPSIHNRHSLRLSEYDYSRQGLYFITICVKNRKHLFGEIKNSKMILNDSGMMITNQWKNLVFRFTNIKLHTFVVMPDHFHGIIQIIEVGVPFGSTPTVGDIIGAFKSLSTVEYIKNVKENNWPPFEGKIWQRNYYEHIIRNHKSYMRICNYIDNNPQNFNINK